MNISAVLPYQFKLDDYEFGWVVVPDVPGASFLTSSHDENTFLLGWIEDGLQPCGMRVQLSGIRSAAGVTLTAMCANDRTGQQIVTHEQITREAVNEWFTTAISNLAAEGVLVAPSDCGRSLSFESSLVINIRP